MKDYMLENSEDWHLREAFLIATMGETDWFYRMLNTIEW